MSEYKFKEVMSKPERLAPGHRMCAGCGATIAVRAVLRALHEGDQGACLFFFCPRLIENKGAPPLPNKLANAVMITTSGKHSPTAPSADVPICGIRAI